MDVWQTEKTKIAERGQHLLINRLWCDCKFLVGSTVNQEIVHAHKLILSMSSPMFARMFFGSTPEAVDIIPIPDVQPEAFKAMLKYIYTDELLLDSVELGMNLFYCAKKYLLFNVVTECMNYLGSYLWPDRLLKVYEFAVTWEETGLLHRCIESMRMQTKQILRSANWRSASKSAVSELLKQNVLDINSELDLFDALLVWAKAECARKSLPTDRLSIRSVCADLLKEIRFLTLSPEDFEAASGKHEILEDAEVVAIAENIKSANSEVPMPKGFSCDRSPRRSPNAVVVSDVKHFKRKSQKFCRRTFGSQIKIVNKDSLRCLLTFEVSTFIYICGVRISTQFPTFDDVPTPYCETLYAYLLDFDGTTLTGKHFVQDVRPSTIITIDFNNVVELKPFSRYRIGITFNKPGTYPAVSGCAETESCDGVNFSFNIESGVQNINDGLIRGILFAK